MPEYQRVPAPRDGSRGGAESSLGEWVEPVVGERGSGGVGAAGAVHSAAGVCGGGAEIEPADGGSGPAEAGDGPEDELLVECGGACVEGAADEVGVAVVQVGWGEDPAGQDAVGESGCGALDLPLHAVGHSLGVGVVPVAGDVLAAGVTRT